MTARRPSVLISVPSSPFTRPFLPYIWAILKTYWERHGIADAYDWLPPIFFNDNPEALLKPYDLSAVDVLGLSCYVWNFPLQCAIAERVKAANPNVFVVAGGPHPDCKDGLFFARHRAIDAVIAKDGEITFTKLLSALLAGDRRLRSVPGLHLPQLGRAAMFWTGPPEIPTVFDESPYAAQDGYFQNLKREFPEFDFHATWETNRGCPYSCSFCDWGSSTMSKLRRFDLARVDAELNWFARMGVQYLISVDANFGILPRDLDIAEMICDVHRRTGYPKLFYYSAAKNHPERSVAIAAKFVHSKLSRSHVLAVQHTRPSVLKATDRENISPVKQIAAARSLLQNGVTIDVQLILGIPGDTYEEWAGCLGDLMEWGIHGDYTSYFYILLPNAPAAAPAFMERWKPVTVERFVLADPNLPWGKAQIDRIRRPMSPIVFETASYTRHDWVRMCAFSACVKALHCGSVTRLIAMYLRWTHAIGYSDFYRDLIEHCVATIEPCAAIYAAAAAQYRRLLDDEDASDFMHIDWLPSYKMGIDPSRWILANVCREFDRFAECVRSYLVDRYPNAPLLASLIDYQFNLFIRPEYDRRTGTRFAVLHDWPEYFRGSKGRIGSEYQPDPEPVAGVVVVSDTHIEDERGVAPLPLHWEHLTGNARWREWVLRVLERRHSSATRNFQCVTLSEVAEPEPLADFSQEHA